MYNVQCTEYSVLYTINLFYYTLHLYSLHIPPTLTSSITFLLVVLMFYMWSVLWSLHVAMVTTPQPSVVTSVVTNVVTNVVTVPGVVVYSSFLSTLVTSIVVIVSGDIQYLIYWLYFTIECAGYIDCIIYYA